MQQLDILFKEIPIDDTNISKSKNRGGKPNKIFPKEVFEIIEKYKTNSSTFYRIKNGEFNNLLDKYLKDSVENFSLDFN